MILLFDIGNTHTHLGIANGKKVVRQTNIRTADWLNGTAALQVKRFVKKTSLEGAALCSVVPRATSLVRDFVTTKLALACFELNSTTVLGVGVDYPKPGTIGPDRLANAIAAKEHFGAPVVVVDFGTAVTFDVVNRKGNYVGGIIAPGLSVMTEYLHEKTALLPKIEIREIGSVVGKSTEEAMLVGAVHGYRGLIRELIAELKRELKAKRLPVVTTGGYAKLIASKLPEISTVDPLLTLEGLRIAWKLSQETREQRSKGGEKPCFLCDSDL